MNINHHLEPAFSEFIITHKLIDDNGEE